MNDFQKNELKELKKLLIENNLTRHGRNRLILFIEVLEQQLQQKEDIINKTKSTINQMLTTGYSKETTYYYPAKNGEFEARAKVLLEILDNKGE